MRPRDAAAGDPPARTCSLRPCRMIFTVLGASATAYTVWREGLERAARAGRHGAAGGGDGGGSGSAGPTSGAL